MLLHGLDRWIISTSIKDLPHSYSAYELMYFISGNNLLKGGVLMLLLWYLWFQKKEDQQARRAKILAGILACLGAVFISRVLSLTLPFRNRPVFDHTYNFFSFPVDVSSIDRLSSFPSDHAALFVTLSFGFFYVSRRAGWMAMLYTSLFILFPRIYLGFHYPTDILAGALLGVLTGWAVMSSKWINGVIQRKVMPFFDKKSEWAYLLFFLMTSQIVVLFSDLRSIISFIIHFK